MGRPLVSVYFFIFLSATFFLASCQGKVDPSLEGYDLKEVVEGGPHGDAVRFVVDDFGAVSETKATEVTTANLTSFYVSATRGSGTETSSWNSVLFTDSDSDGVFTANKWWPYENPSYHFYAANLPITFSAGVTIVQPSNNGTDLVCAYVPSPTHNSSTALTFNHAYARLTNVTIVAAAGYTITGAEVYITPKTHGTYNIKTGLWSGGVNGSSTLISNATPGAGAKVNNIYLLPGEYSLSARWTATIGDYSRTYGSPSLVTSSSVVNMVKGHTNSIQVTLGGGATEIIFSTNVTEWDTDDASIPTTFPTT